MSALTITLWVIAFLALVGAGLIAFAEAALISVDRRLLKQQVAEGNVAARRTHAVVSRPEILYGTIMLVVNACMLMYATAAERLLDPWLTQLTLVLPSWAEGWLPIVIAVVILDCILLLFGEIIPKTLSLSNVPRNALAIGPTIYRLGKVMAPVARAVYWIPAKILRATIQGNDTPMLITEHQIRIALALGSSSGAIEHSESALGLKVIDVAETTVDRVMTLRRDIFSLPAEMSVREALQAIRKVSHSRIPLHRRGEIDEIIGILNIKDLMGAFLKDEFDRPLASYGRPVLFIPEKKKVFDLMLDFRNQRMPLALVVDEAGSLTGLVTLEDCLEEVVGEIYDEHDAAIEYLQQVGDDTFVVDGRMEVQQVKERLGVELDDSDYQTIGGLVMGLAGRVPVTGTRISYNGLTITVTRMVGRRIDKLRIFRHPETATDSVPDPAAPSQNPRTAPGGADLFVD